MNQSEGQWALYDENTVKVASLARVEVGLSFWAYAAFNVFFIAAMLHYDKFQLAQAIKHIVRSKQALADAV